MLFTAQTTEKVSGKLGGLSFSYHPTARYLPAAFPPHSQRVSLARARRPVKAVTRSASQSLFIAADAAWDALTDLQRYWWTQPYFLSYWRNVLGNPGSYSGKHLFLSFYMLLQPRGLYSTYYTSPITIYPAYNPARFRALHCSIDLFAHYFFTMSLFIPDYWGRMSNPSHLVFDYAAFLLPCTTRFRGTYDHHVVVPVNGLSGRACSFTFQGDITPYPLLPARIFYRARVFELLSQYAYPDRFNTVYHEIFNIGYVDYTPPL